MVSERSTPRSGLRPGQPGVDALLFRPKHAAFAKILFLCGLTALMGCVDTVAQREPEPQVPKRTNMARREGVSPRGAAVGIYIDSASPEVADRLWHLFEAEARDREINVTGDAKRTNYFANAVLAAAPAEGGTVYSFIWDLYSAKNSHAHIQRIDDQIFVKGPPVSIEAVDDAILTQIAAKSADDLAAVLSNMPEAIAAASSPASKAFVARASEDGTTTVLGTSPAPRELASGMAAAR
jgi:hypothetical protein